MLAHMHMIVLPWFVGKSVWFQILFGLWILASVGFE